MAAGYAVLVRKPDQYPGSEPGRGSTMDASQVETLFRQAVANDDAAAFRQGLEGFLGTDGHGLSPARENEVRRPDVVIDIPQSRERFRGRDSIRRLQETWPEPAH